MVACWFDPSNKAKLAPNIGSLRPAYKDLALCGSDIHRIVHFEGFFDLGCGRGLRTALYIEI